MHPCIMLCFVIYEKSYIISFLYLRTVVCVYTCKFLFPDLQRHVFSMGGNNMLPLYILNLLQSIKKDKHKDFLAYSQVNMSR